MKIRGWTIEGFGIFHGDRVMEIPDGISVFHGPNEAGKSTLYSFLRGTLFGYAGQNKYPPLAGGKHGGSLTLELQDGTRVRVERGEASRKKFLKVTYPDGREGGEEELRRLLGGADDKLFKSVFSFSLAELQTFESLSEEGVRDRIFSAGISGAGRSARDVIARIDKRTPALLKSLRGESRIQTLLKELDRLAEEREKARQAMQGYPERLEQERSVAAAVETLAARVREAGEKERFHLKLLELWPVYLEWKEASDRLEAGGEERARTILARVEALERRLELYRERAQQRLPRLRREAELAAERAQEALSALGEGWDERRVRQLDPSIPYKERIRAWERALAQEALLVREARGARDTARAAVEEQRRALLSLGDLAEGPVREADAAVRSLRAATSERLRLESEALAWDQRLRDLDQELLALGLSPGQEERLGSAKLEALGRACLGAGVLTFVAALGCAWLGSWGPWAASLALSVAAAWGAHLLRGTASQARRASFLRDESGRARNSREALSVRLAQLEVALQTHARVLGIEGDLRISSERLEALAAQVDEGMRALALRRQAEQRLSEREEALRGTEEAWIARDSAARVAEAQWAEWKKAHGLPEELSPVGAMEFTETAIRAQRALRDRDQAQAAASAAEEEIREWEHAARELVPDLGGEELVAALLSLRDQCRSILAAEQRASALARQISARVGEGTAESGAFRAELALGRVDEWQRLAEEARKESQALQAERDRKIRELRDHETARKALEESADVASIEARIESLRAELADCVREWSTLALARSLVESTLAIYTRTRQPAVLAEASRLLAQVTDGRYARIVQEDDGIQCAVLDSEGRKKSPGELSLGTEQQLYLCLRLGLIAEFARQSVSLPLVMDDVLVNFDPERAFRMAQVLAELSSRHQILFFTCHPGTVEILRRAAPSARQFQMERRYAALSPVSNLWSGDSAALPPLP